MWVLTGETVLTSQRDCSFFPFFFYPDGTSERCFPFFSFIENGTPKSVISNEGFDKISIIIIIIIIFVRGDQLLNLPTSTNM